MSLDVDDVTRLKFIRDEVKHEFNLLAMRSTVLVTCQSFLVVPFAILNTSQAFLSVTVPAILICILGIATTLLIKRPISTAHGMIDHWLVKQANLLRDKEDPVYISDRDRKASERKDDSYDSTHKESLAFSRHAPNAFLVFWILALSWVLVRATATGTSLLNEILLPRRFQQMPEQFPAQVEAARRFQQGIERTSPLSSAASPTSATNAETNQSQELVPTVEPVADAPAQ